MRPLLYLLMMLVWITEMNGQEIVSFFRSASKSEHFDAGLPLFSGMAGPVYTPELGLAIKGSAAVSFKLKRNNDYLQHSVFFVSGEVNTSGSFRLSSRSEIFAIDDFLLFTLDATSRNMDDHYWGAGAKRAAEVERGEETTAYHRKSYLLHPVILVRLFPFLYAGISYEINRFRASDISPLLREDADILAYGTDIHSEGIGLTAFFDKRNRFSPIEKGYLLRAEFIHFPGEILVSDYIYQKFELNYRHHLPVVREGSLLSLQLDAMASSGDVPWNALAFPGGIDGYKGYYDEQYRDRRALSLIAEYQHFFMRRNGPAISRHGIFYWLGGATVFDEFSDFGTMIFSTGGGYQYRIQPNIFLRAEVGFGTENVGFYCGLKEAF